MLTVEEYISQMKKKDKLDEFNFRNHAENMAKVISYVMEYFNNYLNPEVYDYEKIKIEQSLVKIEKEIAKDFLESKDFIIEYYRNTKTRIDRVLKNAIKDYEYMDLFYLDSDYEKVVADFCSSSKIRSTDIAQYRDKLMVLVKEIKKKLTEKPQVVDFKFLDSRLISWIQETYREYGVNLYEFAGKITWNYYEKYVESKYDKLRQEFTYINHYNYRYNDNAFEVEEIYKDNSHRPFINGHKGELEMIIMYDWLFYHIKDTEYWSEYVNLCISTERVNIVKNINVLNPVSVKELVYPSDITSNLQYITTNDGTLKIVPASQYILKLTYNNDKDNIWKSAQDMSAVTNNLLETFKKYGQPFALELAPPLRSPSFNEIEFLKQYLLLEKSLKKHKDMRIAIANGPLAPKNKAKHLIESIEDISQIINYIKEMKLKLKLSIDIPKLVNRRGYYKSTIEEIFNRLAGIRDSIIGVHISDSLGRVSIPEIIYKDNERHLNKFDYPQKSDLLECLSVTFNDNINRYFIPEDVKDNEFLEELVDNLLRGGFTFKSMEGY
jgi:hypothetical protein